MVGKPPPCPLLLFASHGVSMPFERLPLDHKLHARMPMCAFACDIGVPRCSSHCKHCSPFVLLEASEHPAQPKGVVSAHVEKPSSPTHGTSNDLVPPGPAHGNHFVASRASPLNNVVCLVQARVQRFVSFAFRGLCTPIPSPLPVGRPHSFDSAHPEPCPSAFGKQAGERAQATLGTSRRSGRVTRAKETPHHRGGAKVAG